LHEKGDVQVMPVHKVKRKLIKITCHRCGKESEKRKDHADRNEHNFCSRECAVANANLAKVAKSDPNGRKVKWVKIGDQYKREHVAIAEKILGRKMKKTEVVHHIDENPLNNDHSNLVIMYRSDHTALHWRMKNAGN